MVGRSVPKTFSERCGQVNVEGGTTMVRTLTAGLLGLALALTMVAAAGGARPSDRTLPAGTRFMVPTPNTGAVQQSADLVARGKFHDAALIEQMALTPQAVWVTKGSPKDARKAVQKAIARADAQQAVAVLVAYNIPGRDCGGLSAGGAQTPAGYESWISGFADGIGPHKAVVILEPDGLGLLPSNCGSGFPFSDGDRYAELNFAVDALEAKPNAIVYLDATHTGWLNVGDASQRLVDAGVQRAQGFFLNLSNYQFTPNLVHYGTWVSKCIAYATAVTPGNFGSCPNQYWNGGPHPALIADLLGEWTGVALSTYGVWSDSSTTPELNTSGINLRYANMLGTTAPTARFVVDTSRNGGGPWQFTPGTYTDPQDWCNPPGRGLGMRPVARPVPGNPLLDAYLWVKIPGESDGQCTRGTAGPADPEWGLSDPAAGEWFPQQALELAQLANQALLP